jgi:hypothetical protein
MSYELDSANYCQWEHFWYLAERNCEWIDELETLCFDRKDLFACEETYSDCIDTLMAIYEIQPQRSGFCREQVASHRLVIAKRSGMLAYLLEKMIEANENLAKMKCLIMLEKKNSSDEDKEFCKQTMDFLNKYREKVKNL